MERTCRLKVRLRGAPSIDQVPEVEHEHANVTVTLQMSLKTLWDMIPISPP